MPYLWIRRTGRRAPERHHQHRVIQPSGIHPSTYPSRKPSRSGIFKCLTFRATWSWGTHRVGAPSRAERSTEGRLTCAVKTLTSLRPRPAAPPEGAAETLPVRCPKRTVSSGAIAAARRRAALACDSPCRRPAAGRVHGPGASAGPAGTNATRWSGSKHARKTSRRTFGAYMHIIESVGRGAAPRATGEPDGQSAGPYSTEGVDGRAARPGQIWKPRAASRRASVPTSGRTLPARTRPIVV